MTQKRPWNEDGPAGFSGESIGWLDWFDCCCCWCKQGKLADCELMSRPGICGRNMLWDERNFWFDRLIITLSFCWTSVNSCNVCAKCCCCWCGFQGALAAILVNAIISDQIRFYQNSNIDFHFFAFPKTMLSEQQRNLCDDINRILVSFVWLFQRGSKYIIKHPWYFNFRR